MNTAVLLPEFLFSVLSALYQDIRNLTGDEQRSGLNIPILKTIRIPLPSLEVQNQIVAEIEGYQKTIEEHRNSIRELEERSKAVINKVWGQLRYALPTQRAIVAEIEAEQA